MIVNHVKFLVRKLLFILFIIIVMSINIPDLSIFQNVNGKQYIK
jgi:hypothetical protein